VALSLKIAAKRRPSYFVDPPVSRYRKGQRSIWSPLTVASGRPVAGSPYADRRRARAARHHDPRDVP